MELLFSTLGTTFAAGTVLMLAATGELLAQRTGVLNVGIEGVMAMGAVSAIAVAFAVPDAYVALGAAMLVGLLMGCIFAVATVVLRVNQILAGLALSFLGLGLAGTIGIAYAGLPAPARLPRLQILPDVPLLANAISNQPLVVYFAYLVLPLLATLVLYRTAHGLSLRAVGENPAAADAAGISVMRYRFAYVCLGSILAAAAGAFLTLSFTPGWSDGVTAGRGWIAIALVIFARWQPLLVVAGAILFGGSVSLGFLAQAQGVPISASLLSTVPYLLTIALLVIPMWRASRSGRSVFSTPASLGEPFHRGRD